MIGDQFSGRLSSTAGVTPDTARIAVQHPLSRVKRFLLRRACERAAAEIDSGRRYGLDWARAVGLTPSEASLLADELRALARFERDEPRSGCHQTPSG